MIVIPYNISARDHVASLYYRNCFEALPNDKGINIISEDVISSGDGFKSIEVRLSMDPQEIIANNDTEIYDGTIDGGDVFFCLRECLMVQTTIDFYEINCAETKISIRVDLTGGFASFNMSANLEQSAADVVSKTMKYDEFLEVYQCNRKKEKLTNPKPLTQGDMIRVCVRSNNSDKVNVKQITTLELSQIGGQKFSAISDGKSTVSELVVTEGDECTDETCMAMIQILSMFFNEDEPENLVVTGQVQMTLASRRQLSEHVTQMVYFDQRHLVSIHDRVRGNEDQDDSKGSFHMSVKLANDSHSAFSAGKCFKLGMAYLVVNLLYFVSQ